MKPRTDIPPSLFLLLLLLGATSGTNSPDEEDKDKTVLKKKADIHLVVSAGDSRRTKVMTIPLDASISSGRNSASPATYVYPPTTVDLYPTSEDSSSPSKPDDHRHRDDHNAKDPTRLKGTSYRQPAPSSMTAAQLFQKQESSTTINSDGGKSRGSSSSNYDYESRPTYNYFSNEVLRPGHREKQGAFDGRANWKPVRHAPDKQRGDPKIWSYVEGPREKFEPQSRRVPNEDVDHRQQRHHRHPEPTREERDYPEVHSSRQPNVETTREATEVRDSRQNRPQYHPDSTEYVPEYYEPRPRDALLAGSESESNVREENIRMIRLPAPQNQHHYRNYEESPPKLTDSYQEPRPSHYPQRPDSNYRVIRVPVPVDYEPRHFRQTSVPNQRYYEFGKPRFHHDEPRLPRHRERYNNEELGHPRQYEDEIYYHRNAKPTYHEPERGARYVQPVQQEQQQRRVPMTMGGFEPNHYRHQQFVEESRPFPAHFYQQHHGHRQGYRHGDHELDASDSIPRPLFAMPGPNTLPAPSLVPGRGIPNVDNPFPGQNSGMRVVRLPYDVIQNIMRGNSQIDVLNLK